MNLNVNEIKKLLKRWHFYKAIILTSQEEELIRKLNAIETYINALDGVDSVIMRMRFYQKVDMDTIASQVFMSRRAVYYRIDKVLEDMAFTYNCS